MNAKKFDKKNTDRLTQALWEDSRRQAYGEIPASFAPSIMRNIRALPAHGSAECNWALAAQLVWRAAFSSLAAAVIALALLPRVAPDHISDAAIFYDDIETEFRFDVE